MVLIINCNVLKHLGPDLPRSQIPKLCVHNRCKQAGGDHILMRVLCVSLVSTMESLENDYTYFLFSLVQVMILQICLLLSSHLHTVHLLSWKEEHHFSESMNHVLNQGIWQQHWLSHYWSHKWSAHSKNVRSWFLYTYSVFAGRTYIGAIDCSLSLL